ncbi:Dimer Tnp hAT domain-containing protein [Aphis craccivora]|uniref:Dimer Tnp hAT domain-containing protein n=1 Tax=Aphis craccivora TaxID=307492 RepID=A0A6G0XX89_APHCR|nr:Dimer Tnp hAT domain-containing protein [Aphis craccivora]
MYLLHSIFIPTSRKVTIDDNGKKSYTKYSIKDSQNTFIKICDTSAEMEALIGAIPPCILVIGLLNDPKQILVYFDNIKYIVFSSSKAFDICFKIYHVFNIEYPMESIDTSSLLKQVTAELKHYLSYNLNLFLIKYLYIYYITIYIRTFWSNNLGFSILIVY